MRIIFVGSKGIPSKSGAERVVEALVARMKERHDITVICSAAYVPASANVPGVRLVRIPVPRGKHIQPLIYFLFSGLYVLIGPRFDVAHVHNVEASFIIPLLRIRTRVVATSHGSAYEREKWGRLPQILLRMTEPMFVFFSSARTSVSKPLADYYKKRFGRDVSYIPNGIDPELPFDDEAAFRVLRQNNAPEDNYVLFAAGRIDPTKGCHYLLEAIKNMPSKIRLVVVGDMRHAPGYEKTLRTLADDRVAFIPFVESKPVLMGIVRRARVFVFPSTVEAMSMMLLEVVAMGVPVIWSDIPENQAVMPSDELRFRSEDVDDLSRRLSFALKDIESTRANAINVRNNVIEGHSWGKIAKTYESFYLTKTNDTILSHEKAVEAK